MIRRWLAAWVAGMGKTGYLADAGRAEQARRAQAPRIRGSRPRESTDHAQRVAHG
jgi:hypothetical protein